MVTGCGGGLCHGVAQNFSAVTLGATWPYAAGTEFCATVPQGVGGWHTTPLPSLTQNPADDVFGEQAPPAGLARDHEVGHALLPDRRDRAQCGTTRLVRSIRVRDFAAGAVRKCVALRCVAHAHACRIAHGDWAGSGWGSERIGRRQLRR